MTMERSKEKLDGLDQAADALNALVAIAHGLAIEKGWHDGTPRNIGEALALVHSEISEALEAYRVGDMDVRVSDTGKPEGFAIELADAVIRIADLCGLLGIRLGDAVRIKHQYNRTRPWRHGGKKA